MEDKIIHMFNPETNITYQVRLDEDNYKRAVRDVQFAQSLLLHAESTAESNNSNVTEPDNYDKLVAVRTSIDSAEDCIPCDIEDNLPSNSNKTTLTTSHPEFWSNDETLLLITIYGEHKDDFLKAKRRKEIWTMISERMATYGYNRSPAKIERKWLNLMLVYRKIKDNATPKKTGRCAMTYKYFERIDEILGDKPSNKTDSSVVLAVGASGSEIFVDCQNEEHLENASSSTSTIQTDNSESQTVSEDSEQSALPTVKKRKTLATLTREYQEMKKTYLTSKEEAKQKRHDEHIKLEERKFALEERKINVLEKLLKHIN